MLIVEKVELAETNFPRRIEQEKIDEIALLAKPDGPIEKKFRSLKNYLNGDLSSGDEYNGD